MRAEIILRTMRSQAIAVQLIVQTCSMVEPDEHLMVSAPISYASITRQAMVRVCDDAGNWLSDTTMERASSVQNRGQGMLCLDESGNLFLRLHHLATPPSVPEAGATASSGAARRRRHRIANIRKRDGDHCFYCHKVMDREDMTLEHLLPQHLKASESALNMVLAHKRCNEQAGDLSVAEKVRLREKHLIGLILALEDNERQHFLQSLRIVNAVTEREE